MDNDTNTKAVHTILPGCASSGLQAISPFKHCSEAVSLILEYFLYKANKHVSSSTQNGQPCIIRWSTVQPLFEQAIADTLVIMDCRYYGIPVATRRRGTLEVLAAASFEEQASPLARCAFTQALSEKLRIQAARVRPFSAAQLHAHLLAEYPRIVQDMNPEREFLSTFPAPLHIQHAGSQIVPSVLLAPLRGGRLNSNEGASPLPGGEVREVRMTVRLDQEPDADLWADWLRLMPDGIREVQIEGAFRSALR